MSKTEINKFLALDCATTNSGFALFDNGNLIKYGKLFFAGDTEHEKALNAGKIIHLFLKEYPVPLLIMESSFFGINPKIATNLAMSHGAVIGAAGLVGVEQVASVVPIQWQSGIGNPKLTPDDKRVILEEYPNKSPSWYKKTGNLVRKERTIKIVNNRFNIKVDDNDVADAIGIGMFVLDNPEKVRW